MGKIDIEKIETILKHTHPIEGYCQTCYSRKTFIPKSKLTSSSDGEEFEIIYACSGCGGKR